MKMIPRSQKQRKPLTTAGVNVIEKRILPSGIPAEWVLECSECSGDGWITKFVPAFNGSGSLGCSKCSMRGFVLSEEGCLAIKFLASFLKEEMQINVSGGWE